MGQPYSLAFRPSDPPFCFQIQPSLGRMDPSRSASWSCNGCNPLAAQGLDVDCWSWSINQCKIDVWCWMSMTCKYSIVSYLYHIVTTTSSITTSMSSTEFEQRASQNGIWWLWKPQNLTLSHHPPIPFRNIYIFAPVSIQPMIFTFPNDCFTSSFKGLIASDHKHLRRFPDSFMVSYLESSSVQ